MMFLAKCEDIKRLEMSTASPNYKTFVSFS